MPKIFVLEDLLLSCSTYFAQASWGKGVDYSDKTAFRIKTALNDRSSLVSLLNCLGNLAADNMIALAAGAAPPVPAAVAPEAVI